MDKLAEEVRKRLATVLGGRRWPATTAETHMLLSGL